MKKLTVKSTFQSLLILLAISFIVASCEKENIDPDIAPETATTEDQVIFTLTDELDNMSDIALTNYLAGLTDMELMNLGTTATTDNSQSRSCGNWSNINSYCTYMTYHYCAYYNRFTRRVLQRRWCGPPTGGGYEYRWISLGCC